MRACVRVRVRRKLGKKVKMRGNAQVGVGCFFFFSCRHALTFTVCPAPSHTAADQVVQLGKRRFVSVEFPGALANPADPSGALRSLGGVEKVQWCPLHAPY